MELDNKNVSDTVSFIEGKEMACNALAIQPITAAVVSSYKATNSTINNNPKLTKCKDCHKEIEQFSWSRRQRMIECTLCLKCWQRANPRKMEKQLISPIVKNQDETNALLLVGAVTSTPVLPPTDELLHIATVTAVDRTDKRQEIVIDHHIFDSNDGWRRMESMQHPTLRLRLSTEKSDYDHVGASYPRVAPSYITVVTYTGAQCLWGLQDYYRFRFKKSDLLPVKRGMVAANREEIKIEGAIFIRLSGNDVQVLPFPTVTNSTQHHFQKLPTSRSCHGNFSHRSPC